MSLSLGDVVVAGACLAGIPAISTPAGRSEWLPVGMQLLAPAWGEAKMLAAASAFEGVIDPRKEVR